MNFTTGLTNETGTAYTWETTKFNSQFFLSFLCIYIIKWDLLQECYYQWTLRRVGLLRRNCLHIQHQPCQRNSTPGFTSPFFVFTSSSEIYQWNITITMNLPTGPTILKRNWSQIWLHRSSNPGFPHVSLYLYHQVRIITEMLLTIIIRKGATTKTELFLLLGQWRPIPGFSWHSYCCFLSRVLWTFRQFDFWVVFKTVFALLIFFSPFYLSVLA